MVAEQRQELGGKHGSRLLQLKHRDLPSRDLSGSADALTEGSCKLLEPFQGAGFASRGTLAAGAAGTHGQAHAARSSAQSSPSTGRRCWLELIPRQVQGMLMGKSAVENLPLL